MIHFAAIGLLLGLSAGFAPGPLLALVISETLQHDVKSGIKVALSPFITDLPIVIITLFLFVQLSNFNYILGVISLCGGAFVLMMGWESFRADYENLNFNNQKSISLRKGVIVNALSPHPYLFWITVGSPIITKAWNHDIVSAAAFIICFYGLLVGAKIFLAILVGKSKSFIKDRLFIYIMRSLGFLLCLLALFLFYDGYVMLFKT